MVSPEENIYQTRKTLLTEYIGIPVWNCQIEEVYEYPPAMQPGDIIFKK